MSDTDFDEALNAYYKLKSNYEKKYQDLKNKIIKNPLLNKKEKQSKLLSLKQQCVKCKRPVGTIFSNKKRVLRAICGDTKEPCDLNIELKLGSFYNLEDLTMELFDEAKSLKNTIILTKLDLLFNYLAEDEAVAKFDKSRKELNSTSNLYVQYRQEYLNITDNSEKKIKVKNLQDKIFINIEGIKKLVKQYNDTGNEGLIKDVIGIYQSELMPQLKDLLNTKYALNTVDYNEVDNTYHLVQDPYTLSELIMMVDQPEILVNKK